MTTVTPTTTGRRGRRAATASATSNAPRFLKGLWNTVWLLGVPLLVGFYVNQVAGGAWGAVPAPWLAGDSGTTGPSIAGGLAVVFTFVVCVVMHRKQLDLPLGLLPLAGALVAHFATYFVVGVVAWYGVVAGLAIGVVVVLMRRRQGR